MGHLTQTALLKVFNDVYENVDAKLSAVIVVLDRSAAFGKICHLNLLDRLQDEFGVEGIVLSWIKSYLMGHNQFVKIGSQSSTMSRLNSGVSPGSVLGSL